MPIWLTLLLVLGCRSLAVAAGFSALFCLRAYAQDYVPIEAARNISLTQIYDRGRPNGGVCSIADEPDAQLLPVASTRFRRG
jgi:hypothetical protein